MKSLFILFLSLASYGATQGQMVTVGGVQARTLSISPSGAVTLEIKNLLDCPNSVEVSVTGAISWLIHLTSLQTDTVVVHCPPTAAVRVCSRVSCVSEARICQDIDPKVLPVKMRVRIKIYNKAKN